MSPPKNVIETLRDIVQDLLVPELKAVKVSVEALNHQMDSIRTEMKLRDEKMEQFVGSGYDRLEQMTKTGDERLEQMTKAGYDRLETMVRTGDDRLDQTMRFGNETIERAIHSLTEKLDGAIDVRERLATIEARMPKQ